MPAKDKSNNNSNNSHSTLSLPPSTSLPHSLTALRSQPLVLLSVALLLLLHFCWRRAKKATKIIAISPRTPLHHHPPPFVMPPCPAQTACPLASNSPHTLAVSSTQLTSPHTQKPNPTHPTPQYSTHNTPSPAPPHVACPMPPKPFTKLGTQLFVNSSAAAIRFGHG